MTDTDTMLCYNCQGTGRDPNFVSGQYICPVCSGKPLSLKMSEDIQARLPKDPGINEWNKHD